MNLAEKTQVWSVADQKAAEAWEEAKRLVEASGRASLESYCRNISESEACRAHVMADQAVKEGQRLVREAATRKVELEYYRKIIARLRDCPTSPREAVRKALVDMRALHNTTEDPLIKKEFGEVVGKLSDAVDILDKYV